MKNIMLLFALTTLFSASAFCQSGTDMVIYDIYGCKEVVKGRSATIRPHHMTLDNLAFENLLNISECPEKFLRFIDKNQANEGKKPKVGKKDENGNVYFVEDDEEKQSEGAEDQASVIDHLIIHGYDVSGIYLLMVSL